MADKPSRALVIYGDGHAKLVSPLHSHLHSFASRASCGFLSLRDPPDAHETENDRRIREIAQLLDAYDFNAAMKGCHLELNVSRDNKDLPVPAISQRFMGLRAAMFTNCPMVGSLASNLGFSVLQFSDLIKRIHANVDPNGNFDNNAIVLELLKLLGFLDGKVLDDYDFDLVFLHITPDHKLNDEKNGKVISTDINFFNKLVGGVVNAAHHGSPVVSRLHFSVVLSYGAVSSGDQSCSLNLKFAETNSDLLLFCPRQSYTMKGGNILSDIRLHHPMLIAQWQEGVTRRDMAMRFCFDDFRERGGNLAILSDRFLYEKIVLKLELNDVKDKQKAMKAVSILQGIDSIGIDMNAKTMTVIGSVDPVSAVSRLRKFWHTNIVSIGPAKEEKKEEPKKEEAKEEKKEESKKEEEIKEETKKEEIKEEVPKKEPLESQMTPEFVNPYKAYYNNPPMNYNPYTTTHYYYVPSAQDNPNSCCIV